ncbi:membrane protein insertase YidC [Roseateles sp. BYS180W]|uniref:Membrane protein insertase YidC n=1 Tax=Roseateles rivi TaxID=3299028 RepID=A0ABW7FTK5_9BURK
MTEIRRTALWVVFTLSLLMLWDAWQKHNGQPSLFSPAPAASVAAASAPASGAALPSAAALPTPAGQAALPAAATAPKTASVQIETDLVKATLDTLGGSMTRVELRQHKDAADPSGHVVVLTPTRSYRAETGLVGVPGAPNHLSVMTLVDGPRTLQEGQDTLTLRFESPEQAGLKLAKTYEFRRGSYVVNVKHEVQNVGATALTAQLYKQLVRDGHTDPTSMFMAPASFTGPAVYTEQAKFQKVDFESIRKGKAEYAKQAQDGWVAMVQHYFVSAWLHTGVGAREFYVKQVQDNLYSVGSVASLPQIAPGATVSASDQLYVGPQEEKKLAALAPGLELVKDYGWFTVLSKPLFWLLDALHGVLGNWGWAIIALVVLLKIAFYWLNASAYRSMAKMKAVNPRIMELRERLKDKPQQLQQEMMRIYREEKVNPLGSCLPILLQMPFFIALYWVLLSSVEMRHAPWVWWITDLSAKDPFFVLPLLMTASSLLQVWLNPTPPDPMQAKMMWIMPLLFSVFFFFFPAGLVLYWLVNNLLSIAQQWMINKQMGVQN